METIKINIEKKKLDRIKKKIEEQIKPARPKTIPYLPITYNTASKFMYPFEGRVLNLLVKFFPSLETGLEQTESGLTATEYLGGAIISSSIFFLLVTVLLFTIVKIGSPVALENDLSKIVLVATGLFFSFVVFLNAILYPNWKAQRLSAEYERDLIFAVRHLMIQTSAGIPLFDAVVSVGEERGGLGYGAISREFRRLAKEVKGGKDLTQVLNESASRSPSRYYSRVMWQLANASRTGVPINQILKGLVDYLSDEQRIALRNYGSELNPLALMYMLTTIIGPTLGVVFLMIISTFTAVPVNQTVFAVILAIIIGIQVIFLGLIKSRRPNVAI